MIRKKLKLSNENDEKQSSIKEEKVKINLNNENLVTSNTFASVTTKTESLVFWKHFYNIECKLSILLKELQFDNKIAAVYNPLEYATELHCAYLEKYLNGTKTILFIGMNPGPWGMCQTGVPFGYIPAVRDWMKLTGNVTKPFNELKERPITGLLCDKSEQSGKRFWGLFEKICGDNSEKFFENCFVHNWCPLAFFANTGRNITPADLKPDQRKSLQKICNEHLQKAIVLLKPKIIISIGRYVEDRVKELVKDNNIDKEIIHICLAHPSPRSVNNQNWMEKSEKCEFFKMEKFMETALENAKNALRRNEVPVGCVFVYNNEIIATGANLVNITKNATRHAELICIDTVLDYCEEYKFDKNVIFQNISVIVTVEPCIMCAAALHNLKVKEVLFGCTNDRFGGQSVLNVFKILNSNILVRGGIRADEAMHLLKEFYKGVNPSAPPTICRIKN